MKLTKRLLAMLLTVVMVLTMLPAIALTASAANVTFTKVTSITSGKKYLLVYSGHALNGSTAVDNAPSVTVSASNNKITTDASYAVTITASGSNYNIKCGDGKYIGRSANSNGMDISTSALNVTITYSSGTFQIKGSGGRALGANSSNSYKWRFFAASNAYTKLDLYEMEETSSKTLSSIALSGTYPTTFTTGDTFSHTGMVVTATYSDSTTAVVTNSATWSSPNMSTAGTKTVTVSYTEGGTTKTATYDITVTAPTPATITLSRNGATQSVTGYYVGDSYILPGAGADVNGHKHVGWSTVTIATPGSKPTTNYYELEAEIPSLGSSQTFYAVYAIQEGSGNATTTTDELTVSSLGVTATAYASGTFSNKSVTSDAKYAGQVIKGGTPAYIQFRATSPGGIVTTASGGTAKTITVTWGGSNTNGRILNIYGSNTAYADGSSIYSGTPVGTITFATGATSASYTFTDDYAYIGIRPSSGTAYCSEIDVVWQTGTPSTFSGYTTAPQAPVNPTYTVSVASGITGGSVGASPATAEQGETITVTATPDTGYERTALTYTPEGGSATNINGTTFTMPAANVTVNATFSKINYTITKNAGAHGSITAAATANYQDAVSFTVTPASGYQIASLTVKDASNQNVAFTGSGTSYEITSMPAANVTIAATFELIPTYDYTFYGPNNATVASGNAATVTAPAGSPASITYTYPGETTPTTFTFAGWVAGQAQLTTPGAASGEIIAAGTPITLSADTTYRAVYAPSGSGNGFKLSYTYQSTEYFAGAKGSGSYLNASTDSADAVLFGMDQYNSTEYYYLYYTVNGDKYYLTGSTSTTLTISSANSVPTSGYFLWKETESSGSYTYTSYNTSYSAGRPLGFNNNTKDRFASYNADNALTKTGGAGYLTEPGANYYAVTYNENAGGDTVTNMPENGAVQENTSYTIPATIPERDGYRFDGWATTAGGNVVYAASSLPTAISNVSAAIDLYAKWSVVPQATVTFYEADNTTTFDSASVYEGVAPTAPASEPTKAPSGIYYYTFAGWSRTAGGSVESPMAVIASGETTRAYYPVFTQNAAAFTLNLSGRTKVATEGSFQSTVLTPSLTTTQTGCTATISSLSASYTSGSASIATFTTTGNVLTVTGVAAGSVTLNVTATYDDGHTATKSVTVTVIAGNGGTAGGYKLITIDNTAADVSDYDWTGEYIMVARPNGLATNFNTLEVMQFVWTDDTTATIADSNQNRAEFDLGSATQDDFGVATAANGSVTIHAIHTGEGDYVADAETTADGMIYDRITGFTDGSDNDITNNYVLVFERVDDVNNYYTIRVKGTNYYLTNSSTALSGGNTMGGNASPTSIGTQLMWHLRWAGSADTIDGRASNTITLNGESFTPDCILIESVEALNSNVSRAILYNQSGHMFRVYGEGAYATNGPLIGTNAGYNLFLYGKNNPFEAEIVYDGTPRNTTTDKITVPWDYTEATDLDTLLLEGVLDPESYPGWTILNSSIPTWTLIGAYNPNGTTFSSATSISAISGTQNANFNVANWTASDIGKYYVVKINYQVQDPDGVTHDVAQQAMIVVGASNRTYATVIHEATSQSNTGSYTVPSRIGSTGVDLDAYVRDNYSVIYTDREAVNGLTASQPSAWSYTSQKGYTYSISAAGVVTWDPAQVTTDDTVEITATAGLTDGSSSETVAPGSITLYIKQLAYSGEVVATPDSSVTEIPYGATAFAVTLDNFRNNDNAAPGSSTYSINAATAWNWTASTINGTAVPITRTSTGATIDATGLATGTEVIVRATNVIASSNVVANTHTVVTITGKIFTVGEDNSMAAVNDSFVLDFDRDAKLNVLANDRNADGATLTLGAAPTGVTLTKNNDNTITFGVPGGQLTTATYTFTYTLTKSGETDSTATVTVKPSSAIYYEDTNDDFFTYTDGTKGKWSEVGSDSGWLQDASAAADGFDAANNCLTWSAGVAHKANVGKTTDYGTSSASEAWPKMEFTFVGNAFSISMMRNNYTGLIAVYVDGTKVKNLPTAYGATGGEYDPDADHGGFIYESSDSNYGMPAFYWAAENGAAGTHSVKVQVLYSGAYDHNDPKANNYDVYIDGVTIYNPISGSTAYKYISFRDTVLATGSLGVPATQAHDYAATLAPSSISIGTGTTGTLQLSLTDEGATVYSGYTVVYSSSDTSVATVTTNGSLNTSTGVNTATVTGVSEGTVTITATITTPGGTTLTRTATVNVTDTVYTVTYKLPNGDQEVTYGTERINLGSGVTHLTAAELAEYNAHPYEFRGWAPAAVNDTTTQPGGLLDDNMSITLSGDATYYAVYTYGTTTEDFQLKTDLTNPLVDGETIVIYETEGTGDKYLLSNQDYSSTWNEWRLGVAATPSNGYVKTNNTNLYWTVEATTGGFYLKDQNGNYLTATATDGRLVMTSSPDAKAIWNAKTTGVTGANSVFIYNSESPAKYLQHFSGYAEFGAYTFDEAYSNKNEMQIYVQQPNNLTYTTDLQSTTVRYTVNYWVNGTAMTSEQIVEGSNPSFPNVTGAYTELAGYSHDYTFLGWIPSTISPDSTSAPATIYTSGDTYAVSAATAFYAVFTYTGAGSASEGYCLSDSAPEAGDNFIIAAKIDGTYYALNHSRGTTALTITDGAVADTSNVVWKLTAKSEGNYVQTDEETEDRAFKLNSSSTNYNNISDTNGSTNTGAMSFAANGDGFDMYGTYNTGRHLGLSASTASVQSSAQTLYIFKYSTTGGSANYYATTLGEAAPITHNYQATITPASLALHPGETGSVSATLTDNGATVIGATPTYTTSLASVATVAADGTVTAVANGNATITATYTVGGTDYTATCSVAVTTLATYNVTYYVNGSQYGETESVTQGDSPSFTAPVYDTSSYNAHAYEFLGWKQGSALSADTTEIQTLYVAGNTNVISADTNFYAVYRYVEGGSATTAVTSLQNGESADYVIAANVGGTYYAMSNTFASKISGTSISNPGSSISSSAATGYAVTIEKTSSGWTIKSGSTYLTYASSTNLGTSSNAYTWSIDTGVKGTFRVASGTEGRGLVYRAGTENKFGGYSTGSSNFGSNSEYYDVEIVPVGSNGTTYYATTLNVASAHTYVASIAGSVTLEEGDNVTLTGTLTDNGITTTAYAPTYTSSDSSIVTVDSSTGYAVGVAAGSANVTVSYSVDGTTYSAVCAVTVNAVDSDYAVGYAVQSGVTYSGNSRNGNSITLPSSISIPTSTYNAHSYTLVGWATATGSDSTTQPTCYDPGETVTITDDTTFYPVYSWSSGGDSSTVTDTLTASDFAATNTTYADFSGVQKNTAVYAGNSAKDSSGNIQMRSKNSNSGIVSTTSGGTVKSVTITVGSGTNTVDVYGSNTAYTAATNLYGSSSGTKIGSVSSTGTVTFNDDYAYVGIRSNNGAIYLSSVEIVWSTGSGSGSGTTTYTFTLESQTVADNYVGTVSASPSSVNIGGNTAALSASLTNNGATVSSGDYSVSYARTSGTAATLSGSTLTSGSSGGTVTVTATFTVGGSTVATATCDLVVVDPNASVTVNYVGGSTGYVYNWGTRGEAATFLTAPTSSYYTGSYSYSTLSALSGSSTATAAAIYQSALGTAIHNMLVAKQTSTTSYDGTKTLYKYTDCVGSNTSYMSSYYSGTQITNAWDNGSTWNREHTWPNSKGLNGSDENDIMMLRPTSVSENSSRGNEAYGVSSSYYDPNKLGQDIRGDVARLMLQHLMRWGNTSAFYGTSGVIESRAVLLQWLTEDPVDTWEMGRNDAVQRITGVRNVFVDYPELAFILLGASVPSGYTTPSSSGIVASATYNNTYNGSYTPVTRSSRIVNPGIEYAAMGNEPIAETRGATRAVGGENSDLPVTGAVMLNGIGQISNNDDVMSYLAQYGAQNCLVIPANGAVVFYLTGGSAESQIAIGASALNGTGTTLKVYQISAVSGSSATGTILVEQSLVSSTEMYFAINGIAWTGTKSNVLMVRNEGSAPMLLTNLRAATGTVEGHISTGGTESVGGATRAITRSTDNELQMVIDASAILAGIAGVQSINEGTFDETPVDPVDPVDPVESDIVLRGNSISLNGQIDVNFYVDVPADLLASGVYATLDGVRADFAEGTYGTMVSKKLPAKEMNTKVTLKLYAADGTPLTFLNGSTAVTEHSYSVQDYLTYVIGNPATYGDELVKLCKAMSDYGAYTQIALDFDVNNAKAIYLADEIAAVTCTGCDYSFTPNTENITFLGASVVTESETAIRVYFALSGEGFTATVDGEPAAIQTNERGTFVEIANISAKNLGDTHTIAVTNGSETVTVSDYSAYSYVQSVLSYAGASDSLKLAVKALKLYGDLAAAYFNK